MVEVVKVDVELQQLKYSNSMGTGHAARGQRAIPTYFHTCEFPIGVQLVNLLIARAWVVPNHHISYQNQLLYTFTEQPK